jgi:PPOX class probable F420-dependent enzyme
MMSTNPATQFAKHKYLSIETYRKSGQPVATPVWFAERTGTFYLYSLADAGKVKRIRNNPKVRIVPCDMRGAPRGPWLEAKARILDGQAEALTHRLLTDKYGWMKRIGDAFSKLMHRRRVAIAVEIT